MGRKEEGLRVADKTLTLTSAKPLFAPRDPKSSSPGGLEPPTFRLTAERANRLRHGDEKLAQKKDNIFCGIKSLQIMNTEFPKHQNC